MDLTQGTIEEKNKRAKQAVDVLIRTLNAASQRRIAIKNLRKILPDYENFYPYLCDRIPKYYILGFQQ